jgi:hypothetical protein
MIQPGYHLPRDWSTAKYPRVPVGSWATLGTYKCSEQIILPPPPKQKNFISNPVIKMMRYYEHTSAIISSDYRGRTIYSNLKHTLYGCYNVNTSTGKISTILMHLEG